MTIRRKSGLTTVLFFFILLVLVIPVSPILLICFIGQKADIFLGWYDSTILSQISRLHDKLNPYEVRD
ncbi:TPA: DUF4014 family protein [Klebsiella michiganensis]|nr:DUF4014 family protein [Klebsiella michiganensis]